MTQKLLILLALLFIVVGILLRGEETYSHNFLFLMDQGRDMLAVKGIVYDHHLTLIGPYTSLQGVFQGPLWYYLLSIPTFLFNGDPWGGVVLMFLISLSVLLVVYFWTKRYFGEKAALFALFLFAISPEAIAAATYTWNPHPMWLLLVVYIFSIFSINQKNIKSNLLLWPTIFLMFHFQTALAVFIFLSTVIYFLLFERSRIRNKFFLIGFFLGLLLFLPQVVFDLRHDFLMTKSVFKMVTGENQGLLAGGEKRIFGIGSLNAFYANYKSGLLYKEYLSFVPHFFLSLFGFYLLCNKRFRLSNKKETDFIFVILKIVFIIVVLSFFYPFPIRYWFLTGFQSFYLLPLAVVLSSVWKYFPFKIAIGIVVCFSLFYSGGKIYDLYTRPDYGGVAKIKGKVDSIEYVYKDANGKPFSVFVFAPPVYTDNYDYLIWWLGKNKYGYTPKKEKKETFYLVMEPDPGKPWSYKGWMETVIKSGDILNTKELPSGIIIQKRYGKEEKK